MPRSPRIEFPGARYHVMSRGNRQESILGADADKVLFLETLAECCGMTGWVVHAYVLMANHYHLLLETPEANLSAGMRWLQGTYGTRYNHRHRLVGHVWQGRFKSPVISDEDEGYFRAVSEYIHLNPARAGLLSSARPVLYSYRWSSFPALCSALSKRPEWVEASATYSAYDLRGEGAKQRRQYRERMQLRCRECLRGKLTDEEDKEQQRLLRGWYIGDESFRNRLLDALEESVRGRKRDSLTGGAKAHHDHAGAEALTQACCRHFGVDLATIQERKYNDPEKQAIAWLLRKKTTVPHGWIVAHITMGSRYSVQNAVKAIDALEGTKNRAWRNQILKINNSLH